MRKRYDSDYIKIPNKTAQEWDRVCRKFVKKIVWVKKCEVVGKE